jgi:hypothetical protein
MYQPPPTQLLAVATAAMAERHAEADRGRLIRLATYGRRPKLTVLPNRQTTGRVIRLFDRTPPEPEAA